MTEDPSPHQVEWAAKQYLRMHEKGRRCQQCPDDDSIACPGLAWAHLELQKLQELRGRLAADRPQ